MDPQIDQTDASEPAGKSPATLFFEELLVDAVITVVIVAAVVLLLGEPLMDVLTGWIFIVLVGGSLTYLIYKYVIRRARSNR